jgi:hypothetical protein
MDYATNSVFRREAGVHSRTHRRSLTRAHGISKNLRVQSNLVTESVIHGRDIRAGAPANIPDRRGAVTSLGKNMAGRLDQLVASQVGGVALGASPGRRNGSRQSVRHSNKSLKQTFHYVKRKRTKENPWFHKGRTEDAEGRSTGINGPFR